VADGGAEVASSWDKHVFGAICVGRCDFQQGLHGWFGGLEGGGRKEEAGDDEVCV